MHRLGSLSHYQLQGNRLLLDGGFEQVVLTAVLPGALEVRFLRGGFFEPPEEADAAPSPALAPGVLDGPGPEIQVWDQGQHLLVSAGHIRVRVQRHPFRLTFLDGDGRTLLADDVPGLYWDGWDVGARFQAAPDDRFYGLGEAGQHEGAVALEASGRRFPVWNKHLPGPSRLVVPFVMSRRGYGLLFDNPWPAEFDFTLVRRGRGGRWQYRATGGRMVFYFLAGPGLAGVLDQLTRLTGRPTVPPLWSLGLLQSRYGYRNRAELEEVAATFRRRGIPCDAVILDLYWFREMGDLRFDQAAFPRPGEMIQKLRAQGFRTIVISEPYLAVGSRLFPAASRRGYLVRRPEAAGGGSWVFKWWKGDRAALVDFSHPEARAWWGRQYRPLLDLGISGWWLDLTEPELHYPDMLHHGGPAHAVHNLEGLRMIQAVHDAHAQHAPDRRVFIMSRSGWLGMQRYGATTWSGDVDRSWTALAMQPALGLNTGLVGIGGWSSDVGGFAGWEMETTPEMYVRWMQLGCFSPVCRPHSFQSPREPWAFGPEAEAICADFLRLRYRLVPYTYAHLHRSYATGAPLMRPLVYQYPDDPRTWELGDQYLWGDGLLVAPVLGEGQRRRPVYLPAGGWYDWWSGRLLAGGRRITAPAPLPRLPLYVRAGALVPMAPDGPCTGPWDPCTVGYWPAEGSSAFVLYEDDGESRGYERGEVRRTPLDATCSGDRILLRVGPAEGDFPGAPGERRWRFRVLLDRAPAGVSAAGAPLAPVRSRRALEQGGGGWYYDPRRRTLLVALPPAQQAEVLVER